MAQDILQHLGNDRRPDRIAGHGAKLGHGGDDREIERLAVASINHGDGPRRVAVRGRGRVRGLHLPAQEARDFGQGLDRCGQADALDGMAEPVEPGEAQHELVAALRLRERMDLVDDDAREAREDARRILVAEQKREAFRRGDEDVRRPFDHQRTGVRGSVAGAHRDANLRPGHAHPLGHRADAGQRRVQVALDVVVQGFERRDVEQLHAVRQTRAVQFIAGARRRQMGPNLVDAPQERGQRLAGTGGRQDQGVLANLNGRPGGRLRRSRFSEGFTKPGANRQGEWSPQIGHDTTPREKMRLSL